MAGAPEEVAGVGRQGAAEDAHEGGLAGAVLADQRVDCAGQQAEVHAFERPHAGEGFGNLAHFEPGVSRGRHMGQPIRAHPTASNHAVGAAGRLRIGPYALRARASRRLAPTSWRAAGNRAGLRVLTRRGRTDATGTVT